MITKEHMAAMIEEYCRAETEKDRAAWFALFTEDIIHEDPVGSRTNIGLEKLASIWDSVEAHDILLETTAPIIACGNEAVVTLRAEGGPAGNRFVLTPIINNYVFADDGRISRVRSFHSRG
jgi:hypothetical protein